MQKSLAKAKELRGIKLIKIQCLKKIYQNHSVLGKK
jgi:hypothetical protein